MTSSSSDVATDPTLPLSASRKNISRFQAFTTVVPILRRLMPPESDITMPADDVIVSSQKNQTSSWMEARLSLDEDVNSFRLPLNLTVLCHMTAADYLRHYCVTSTSRHALYDRAFSRYLSPKAAGISPQVITINMLQDFARSLRKLLPCDVTDADVMQVLSFAALPAGTRIDLALFCGLATLAERFAHVTLLRKVPSARIHIDHTEYADFYQFDMESRDLSLLPELYRLLAFICKSSKAIMTASHR